MIMASFAWWCHPVVVLLLRLANHHTVHAASSLPEPPTEWSNHSPPPAFGKPMLSEFYLDAGYINLNHGSYGATPRKVLEAQNRLRVQCETNPEVWFRQNVSAANQPSTYILQEESTRRAVAEYLGADSDDLVFCENASHGIAAVLRSVVAAMSDNNNSSQTILYMDLNYIEVQEAVQFLHTTAAGGRHAIHRVDTSDLGWPSNISSGKIVDAVRNAIKEIQASNHSVGICIFDHIVSVPGIVMPIAELSQLCRDAGGLVLVDGAHAPGQLPHLSLAKTGADFYIGNGHKWLYSPKGAAVLWVRPGFPQTLLEALVIEKGPGNTALQQKFAYQGTADYTAFIALKAALQFRAWIGGDDAIYQHNHGLAVRGCRYLAERWNTTLLPAELMAPFMCNVQVPCPPQHGESNDGRATASLLFGACPANMAQELYHQFNFFIPAYHLMKTNTTWMRISAQIYNDMSDFELVGKSVETYVQSLVSRTAAAETAAAPLLLVDTNEKNGATISPHIDGVVAPY